MPPQRSSVRVRIHPLGDTALVAELGSRLDTALNTRAIALAAALVLPRRATRRTQVPAGSVAIAGQETGIYPLVSPGGWHLIGRTSVRLFLPDSDPPSLFRTGDRVKFFALAE